MGNSKEILDEIEAARVEWDNLYVLGKNQFTDRLWDVVHNKETGKIIYEKSFKSYGWIVEKGYIDPIGEAAKTILTAGFYTIYRFHPIVKEGIKKVKNFYARAEQYKKENIEDLAQNIQIFDSLESAQKKLGGNLTFIKRERTLRKSLKAKRRAFELGANVIVRSPTSSRQ